MRLFTVTAYLSVTLPLIELSNLSPYVSVVAPFRQMVLYLCDTPNPVVLNIPSYRSVVSLRTTVSISCSTSIFKFLLYCSHPQLKFQSYLNVGFTSPFTFIKFTYNKLIVITFDMNNLSPPAVTS